MRNPVKVAVAAVGHLCVNCEGGPSSTLHRFCIGFDPHPASRTSTGDMPVCTCYCEKARSKTRAAEPTR